MILVCHLLFGAALVSKVKILPLAFLLAAFSHYFLDFLPHKTYGTKNIFEANWRETKLEWPKVGLDLIIGVFLIFLLAPKFQLAFWGGILAIFPDFLIFLFLLFPKNRILRFHSFFHDDIAHFLNKKKIPFSGRIFSQAAILILAIFFLIYPLPL